jgi:hypothetical protein
VVNEALVSWSGLVSVRSDANGDTGGATVSLDFDNDPTGQWRGAYHTFINFEDRDLQRWIDAAPDDKAEAAAEDEADAGAPLKEGAPLLRGLPKRAAPRHSLRRLLPRRRAKRSMRLAWCPRPPCQPLPVRTGDRSRSIRPV